jgi:hypothetical protein
MPGAREGSRDDVVDCGRQGGADALACGGSAEMWANITAVVSATPLVATICSRPR